eukprot:3935372-Rhodomonas_salina.1
MEHYLRSGNMLQSLVSGTRKPVAPEDDERVRFILDYDDCFHSPHLFPRGMPRPMATGQLLQLGHEDKANLAVELLTGFLEQLKSMQEPYADWLAKQLDGGDETMQEAGAGPGDSDKEGGDDDDEDDEDGSIDKDGGDDEDGSIDEDGVGDTDIVDVESGEDNASRQQKCEKVVGDYIVLRERITQVLNNLNELGTWEDFEATVNEVLEHYTATVFVNEEIYTWKRETDHACEFIRALRRLIQSADTGAELAPAISKQITRFHAFVSTVDKSGRGLEQYCYPDSAGHMVFFFKHLDTLDWLWGVCRNTLTGAVGPD